MGAIKEPTASLYESDFAGWAQQQADALRERRFDEIDYDNLTEEIESMGRQQRAELVSRLAVLLAHLLKWDFRADARTKHGRSWLLTIKEQRGQVLEVIEDNPSLQPFIGEATARAYRRAALIAAREAGIAEQEFAPACPYSFDQASSIDWMPQ